MTESDLVAQVQAFREIVRTNYQRDDWCRLPGPNDEKAIVKLGIYLQNTFTLGEYIPYRRRWTVASSKGDNWYDVILDERGELRCDCRGFRFRGNCRHVAEIADQLDERQTSFLGVYDEPDSPIMPLLNHVVSIMLNTDDLGPLWIAEIYGLLTFLEENPTGLRTLEAIMRQPELWEPRISHLGEITRPLIYVPPMEDDYAPPEPYPEEWEASPAYIW